jgi:hypothetical protein
MGAGDLAQNGQKSRFDFVSHRLQCYDHEFGGINRWTA